MRTKTLLIARLPARGKHSDLLGSDLFTNIVGYVTVTLPLGYSVVSVPLNSGAATGNAVTNTIVNTGQLDGALLSHGPEPSMQPLHLTQPWPLALVMLLTQSRFQLQLSTLVKVF